ncbi:DMT family transporter [Streptomyces sp. NPDC059009]|uniref:DMT family transporter n=1 Tax=Streptomyces sp. NPDC059009 TaxID=3346694 RepID=UPI0036C6FCD4
MSALALSVLLSLVSAVAYAGGAIMQEQVAASASEAGSAAPVRRPAWWIAIGLNGLGALLHVVALACGPLSLVQPLGALTIVFALPMAAVFVGRRAGATAWKGAGMATAGLAGLLSLTGSAATSTLGGAERVSLSAVTFGLIAVLVIAARAMKGNAVLRATLLAAAGGVAFGIASVFTKMVADEFTWGPGLIGQLPSIAVMVVLAVGGTLLCQSSYEGAGLATPLAVVTVVNPVVAAVVGLSLFGETFRYGTAGTLLALVFGAVTVGGLVLLTAGRNADSALPATATGTLGATEAATAATVAALIEVRPIDISARYALRTASDQVLAGPAAR